MNHSRSLALAGLLVAILCWAGNSLVARAFAEDIAPLTLAFWRWTLAFVLLLPFVAAPVWRNRQHLKTAGWRLWVVSALGIAGYNSFLYSAAHSTEAINISLLNTCIPLMTFLAAGVLLNEWPPSRAWLGMLVAVGGLLVLIGKGDVHVLLGLNFAQGDLLMLVAVTLWALYSVLLRHWSAYLQPIPPMALLGVAIGLGLIMLLPFYGYEYSQGARLELNMPNLGAIAYTAVFASLVSYLAWNHGVKVLGAAKASMTSYLMPVFTAILGWLLLGEQLQSFHLIGGGLIFVGLVLATRQKPVTR